MTNQGNATERFIGENKFAISKTDLEGKIFYTNETFNRVSDYEENELYGRDHNIIRHPDMPKTIFYLLWQHISDNTEFNGYIKNRCKNGDYYWSFASVSPSFTMAGKKIGYYSIRRQPKTEPLQKINLLYERIKDAEARHNNHEQAVQAGLETLNKHLNQLNTSYNEYVLKL